MVHPLPGDGDRCISTTLVCKTMAVVSLSCWIMVLLYNACVEIVDNLHVWAGIGLAHGSVSNLRVDLANNKRPDKSTHWLNRCQLVVYYSVTQCHPPGTSGHPRLVHVSHRGFIAWYAPHQQHTYRPHRCHHCCTTPSNQCPTWYIRSSTCSLYRFHNRIQPPNQLHTYRLHRSHVLMYLNYSITQCCPPAISGHLHEVYIGFITGYTPNQTTTYIQAEQVPSTVVLHYQTKSDLVHQVI